MHRSGEREGGTRTGLAPCGPGAGGGEAERGVDLAAVDRDLQRPVAAREAVPEDEAVHPLQIEPKESAPQLQSRFFAQFGAGSCTQTRDIICTGCFRNEMVCRTGAQGVTVHVIVSSAGFTKSTKPWA